MWPFNKRKKIYPVDEKHYRMFLKQEELINFVSNLKPEISEDQHIIQILHSRIIGGFMFSACNQKVEEERDES